MAAFSLVLVATAQNACVMVSSYDANTKKSTIKVFDHTQLAEAFNEANPNDTIYFTEGRFSLYGMPIKNDYVDNRGVTRTLAVIDKPLTLIGAGKYYDADGNEHATTLSYRDLGINLKGNIDNKSNVTIEGVSFDNGVFVISDLNQLILKNTYIGGGFDCGNSKNDLTIEGLLIDRCKTDYVNIGDKIIKNVEINNSKLGVITGKGTENVSVELNYCYIKRIDSSFEGNIRNSIISYDNGTSDVNLKNCVYFSSYGANQSTKVSCFRLSDSEYDNAEGFDNNQSSFPSLDYNGDSINIIPDDGGTLVGSLGGDTPYTLNSSYPVLDYSKTKIDANTIDKQITITINIPGNN